MALKKGQRVVFRPTHAKELQLKGKVVRVHEDGKMVDVVSEAANGSVSRVYTAHADDVVPFKDAVEVPERDETPAEEETREAAEEAEEEAEDRQP
jgi:hypothetical protein